MGCGPKKSDYKASPAEQASAAVGMAEKKFFNAQYGPLLRKMRDKAGSDDNKNNLRARANADTMQALTSQPNAQGVLRGDDSAGGVATGLLGQLGVADKSGLRLQNTMATGVLGTARGQAANAQTGMAKAANLETSALLQRAKDKQNVANAKFNAVGQLAGAGIMKFGNKFGRKAKADESSAPPETAQNITAPSFIRPPSTEMFEP